MSVRTVGAVIVLTLATAKAAAQTARPAWDGSPTVAPMTYAAPVSDPNYFYSNGVDPYFNPVIPPPIYTAADPLLSQAAGYVQNYTFTPPTYGLPCAECVKDLVEAGLALRAARSPWDWRTGSFITDLSDVPEDCGECLDNLSPYISAPSPYDRPIFYGPPVMPGPGIRLRDDMPYVVNEELYDIDVYDRSGDSYVETDAED